jgi:hypothetical protein
LRAVRRLAGLIVVGGALVGAAPASAAAVKVQAPPQQLICGDAIPVGVRAPAGTTGSRVVRVKAVDGPTGTAWFTRRATARRHWKRWFLPSGMDGQCHPTTIVYRGTRADGSRWVKRFKVLFRSERL